MIHTKSGNRLEDDYVFKIAAIKHSLVEHKKLTKDAVFKKNRKIIDVDTKLAMDAVFGNNMEAFPESDDEDEFCGGDGDTEDGDSDDDSDESGVESNNVDDVSAAVVGRGYTN
jgi:hypothetical protein